MLEEWTNSTVIPIYKISDKRKVENYRGINLLNACYKLYSKIVNKKLKTQVEHSLLECQNGFRKDRSCIDPLFSMKLPQKKEDSLIWKPI